MFYLLEDNRIIVDNKNFSHIFHYEDRKGFLYKTFADRNYGKNRKIGKIKKQSENVIDLIEKGDLVRCSNDIHEIKNVYNFNYSCVTSQCGICFPSRTKFLKEFNAIYKPDGKGNYIKVWERK